jgi:hypothetical protein
MKDKPTNGVLLHASDAPEDLIDQVQNMKEKLVNGKNNNSSHADHNHVQHRRPAAHNDAGPQHYDAQGPTDSGDSLASMPTRRELFLDPANICTLIGAMLSTLAMACMWKKE